jgi:hypothetical protein
MGGSGRLLKALLLLQLVFSAAAVSVVVSNGYEFHAAMTSPQVSWILVADNVSGFGGGGGGGQQLVLQQQRWLSATSVPAGNRY